MPTDNWKTISSKTVYKNKKISVTEDQILKPNGQQGIYGYVKIPPTVGIVALDKKMNIYLCHQFRYIFKDESYEIPRGFAESGENIKEAAKRELLEEAGVTSTQLTSIGKLRLSPGIINEECNIFLARDVTEQSQDIDIEINKILKVPFTKALDWINKGIIIDGLTVGAVLKVSQILTPNPR